MFDVQSVHRPGQVMFHTSAAVRSLQDSALPPCIEWDGLIEQQNGGMLLTNGG